MSLLKQSALVATARLADKLLSLVIVLWLSRHFGKEGLGEFNYYFSLTSLLLPFVDMGMAMTMMQRWHELDTPGRRRLISQLMVIKITTSALALAGALVADQLNHPLQANNLAVCAAFAALFFDDFADLLRRPAHAQGIVWIEAAFPLLSRVTQFVLVAILINSMQNGAQVLYIYAFANLLELLASFYGLKGAIPASPLNTRASEIWDILKNGFPFALTGVFVMASLHFDSVLLQHYKGYGDVGIYTSATRIIMVLNVLSGGICHALFPKILKAKSEGERDHVGWLLNGTLRVFLILFGAISLGGLVVGPGLMLALYGEKFEAAGPIFQWLSPLILLAALSGLLGQVLEILGQQRPVMWVFAISAVLNIGGNVLLIPEYGMRGSAFATIASTTFTTVALLRMLFKNEHVTMYVNGLGRAMVFLALLGLSYFPLLHLNVYLAVPLGAIYFAALLIMLQKYWLENMGRLAQ